MFRRRYSLGVHGYIVGQHKIVVLLLFLMSMNVLNRFYFMAFGGAALLLLLQHDAIRLPRALLPTVLFSLTLVFFSPSASISVLSLMKQFTYPLCTLVGYNLISSSRIERAEKQATEITVVLAAGACGHYLLNMLINWGSSGSRNTTDFWTNTIIAATGQAALACMMLAVAVALIFADTSKKTKMCMAVILAAIIYYNLTLAGRTLFILLAVAFAVGFCARFFTLRNSAKRLKLIAVVVVICVLVAIIWSTNAFGIRDMVSESNFYNRFFAKNAGEDIEGDGRMEGKVGHIKRMGDYLWGGGNIRAEVGYAHDIILDTYDEAGLVALLSIVIIMIDMLSKCVKICKSRRVSDTAKILIPCVMTVIMLEFMIEPILIGVQWLLASYCVMYGAYSRIAELS